MTRGVAHTPIAESLTPGSWSRLQPDGGSGPTLWEGMAPTPGGKSHSEEGPGGRPFAGLPGGAASGVRAPSPRRLADGPCFREGSKAAAVSTTSSGRLHESSGPVLLSNTGTLCVSPHGCPTHEDPLRAGNPQIWTLPCPCYLGRKQSRKLRSVVKNTPPKHTRLGREQQTTSLPLGARVPWAPPFPHSSFPRSAGEQGAELSPADAVPSALHDGVYTGTCAVGSPVPPCVGAYGMPQTRVHRRVSRRGSGPPPPQDEGGRLLPGGHLTGHVGPARLHSPGPRAGPDRHRRSRGRTRPAGSPSRTVSLRERHDACGPSHGNKRPFYKSMSGK